MNIDPKNPKWNDRDRFILSKGHAAPLLYAILADRGYFPEERLEHFRQIDNILPGHPDLNKTLGVDMTCGSLGQGLSVGIGLALAAKQNNQKYQTYVLMGDGELDEGQVWEALMFANKVKLNKLTVIVDYNGVQLDDSCNEIMPIFPLREKWEAFGWRVIEINGHNVVEIFNALDWAEKINDSSVVIIADTVETPWACPWHLFTFRAKLDALRANFHSSMGKPMVFCPSG
jgi:transketolase